MMGRMVGRTGRTTFLAGVLVSLTATLAAAAPEAKGPASVFGWRGDGTGRHPQATVPSSWDSDEKKNILWRTKVGKGQSSPVLAAGRAFLGAEQDSLVCVDLATGKVLWKADNGFACLPTGSKVKEKRQPSGEGCGYSAATPVTDGASVYMCHGTGIVAAFGLDGKRTWVRYIDAPQATEHGRSASPVLADGKLVVSLGGLIAMDPATGKTLWEARKAKPAYGTPAVTKVGEVTVLVTPNGDIVRASDGQVLASKLPASRYGSPVVHAGVVYIADNTTAALRLPDKAGETLSPVKLWENEDLEGEFFASPVLHEGLLYCLSNEGTLYALDAATGKVAGEQKLELPSAGSPPGMPTANLYASPALVGKWLVVANDIGGSLVLSPGKECRQVARNYIDAGSGACPVPAGKVLLLRGGKWLYAIGQK